MCILSYPKTPRENLCQAARHHLTCHIIFTDCLHIPGFFVVAMTQWMKTGRFSRDADVSLLRAHSIENLSKGRADWTTVLVGIWRKGSINFGMRVYISYVRWEKTWKTRLWQPKRNRLLAHPSTGIHARPAVQEQSEKVVGSEGKCCQKYSDKMSLEKGRPFMRVDSHRADIKDRTQRCTCSTEAEFHRVH